jgi:chromosome segregation ATPase
MSTTTTENPTGPEHLRYEITQLEKMREQILADMENLRTQESNLRAFESRLRGSQPPQVQPGLTQAPMAPNSRSPLLDAEWEKFQRSRALLEAERRALNDDRMALRDEKAELQVRTEALRKRESWIETREKELAAKAMPPPKAPSQTPFEAAKSLFSLRRAS